MLEQQITVLIYTFPFPGKEHEAFAKIEASLETTWKHCGGLKTVVVASHRFAGNKGSNY